MKIIYVCKSLSFRGSNLPRANLVPQFFRVRVYPRATFYSLTYKGTFARRANLLGQ